MRARKVLILKIAQFDECLYEFVVGWNVVKDDGLKILQLHVEQALFLELLYPSQQSGKLFVNGIRKLLKFTADCADFACSQFFQHFLFGEYLVLAGVRVPVEALPGVR